MKNILREQNKLSAFGVKTSSPFCLYLREIVWSHVRGTICVGVSPFFRCSSLLHPTVSDVSTKRKGEEFFRTFYSAAVVSADVHTTIVFPSVVTGINKFPMRPRIRK